MQLLDKRLLRLTHLVTKIFNLKEAMIQEMRKLKLKFSRLLKQGRISLKKRLLKSLQKKPAQDSRTKWKLIRTNA